MTAALSPHVRLVLLVTALAAVLLPAGMFFLTRSDPATDVLAPTAQAAPAKGTAAQTKPTRAASTRRTAARAAASARAERFPPAVSRAFRNYKVVVVSLFVPGGRADRLALREAHAGARAAGAGFAGVNLLNERKGRLLARELGVLESPTVLVYRRGGVLVGRLDGFADRATVAQAATNARR